MLQEKGFAGDLSPEGFWGADLCFSIAIGAEIGNLEKYPNCSSELMELLLLELLESSGFQEL